MNIDEAKALKLKMEKTIRCEIDSFHDSTGLVVKDIDIIWHTARSGENVTLACVYEVNVRVEM